MPGVRWKTQTVSRDGLIDWFQCPSGWRTFNEELKHYDAILPGLFGYQLVQVGGVGLWDVTRSSRVMNQQIVGLSNRNRSDVHAFVANANALPIQSDSIDVVVMPHVLEFESHPENALREVQRILLPEGHVIISGINPWSLIGLRQFILRYRRPPCCGYFLQKGHVRGWLAMHGFDVLISKFFSFPPWPHSTKLLGRLIFPIWLREIFCEGYVLVAKKRQATITRLKAKRMSMRRFVSSGIAEPSPRIMNGDNSCRC